MLHANQLHLRLWSSASVTFSPYLRVLYILSRVLLSVRMHLDNVYQWCTNDIQNVIQLIIQNMESLSDISKISLSRSLCRAQWAQLYL